MPRKELKTKRIIFWVGEIQRENALKRVENKTHNLLGPESNRKRVENKTHNFLGGDFQRKIAKERVLDGTHNLLGPEVNRKRVEEGTHHLLGKGLMSVYDKVEQKIISRIHKDEYHQNRDRYLHFSSKEYRLIKEHQIHE